MLKDYKVNVTQLCESCSISRQYYYDLCSEKVFPSLHNACKIWYYLKSTDYPWITLYDLFPVDTNIVKHLL